MRTAKDLADAIPGGNLTEAIIQNIEAGRKTDLSVSQLLNISLALRVSPAFLLAPLGLPAQSLDLPNLSHQFDGMTVLEFDAWLAGLSNGAYRWKSTDERTERSQVQAMRELQSQLRERSRLRSALELERSTAEDNDPAAEQLWETTEERLHEAHRRVEQLTAYLESAGWDLNGWTD
jgi:hypothetical protein